MTNQIARTSRGANAMAGAVLVVTWAIAGLGNLQENALVWLSPFGWIGKADAFGADHWAVVGLAVVVTLLMVAVAVVLQSRRDVGAGLLPERAGRPVAGPRLRGAYSLAWRLERPVLVFWVIGYVAIGLFIGLSRDALVGFAEGSPALTQILEALGGSGAIIDVFLATYVGLGGVVVAFYAVAMVLRLESEEQSGHTEIALATATRRSRWLSAYVVLAVVGGAVILGALGLVLGLAFGLQSEAGLVTFPACSRPWPRVDPGGHLRCRSDTGPGRDRPALGGLAWVVVGAFALLTELGAVFGLPSWLMNLSPFSHIAKAPAESLALAPMLWLTAIGVAFGVAGYIAFQIATSAPDARSSCGECRSAHLPRVSAAAALHLPWGGAAGAPTLCGVRPPEGDQPTGSSLAWLPLRRGGVGIDPAALELRSPPCGRRGVDQCFASLALGCTLVPLGRRRSRPHPPPARSAWGAPTPRGSARGLQGE